MVDDDGYSGNYKPADSFHNAIQWPIQGVPPGNQAVSSKDLAQRLQLLSELSAPRSPTFESDRDYFQELPPESMYSTLFPN